MERLRSFANGTFHFERGQRPPRRSVWHAKFRAVELCMRHKSFSNKTRTLHGKVECTCGYHEDKVSTNNYSSIFVSNFSVRYIFKVSVLFHLALSLNANSVLNTTSSPFSTTVIIINSAVTTSIIINMVTNIDTTWAFGKEKDVSVIGTTTTTTTTIATATTTIIGKNICFSLFLTVRCHSLKPILKYYTLIMKYTMIHKD